MHRKEPQGVYCEIETLYNRIMNDLQVAFLSSNLHKCLIPL